MNNDLRILIEKLDAIVWDLGRLAIPNDVTEDAARWIKEAVAKLTRLRSELEAAREALRKIVAMANSDDRLTAWAARAKGFEECRERAVKWHDDTANKLLSTHNKAREIGLSFANTAKLDKAEFHEACAKYLRSLTPSHAAPDLPAFVADSVPAISSTEKGAAFILAALVAAMEECHSDPRYQTVWNISQLHIGPYNGLRYNREFEAARSFLRTAPWNGSLKDTTGSQSQFPQPAPPCATDVAARSMPSEEDIARELFEHADRGRETWDQISEIWKLTFRRQARAVLALFHRAADAGEK